MIVLPNSATDAGLITRVLLAECRGPSYPDYSLDDAQTSMQLMDLVLWNRVKDFRLWGGESPTLLSIIKAEGQFGHFANYPSFSVKVQKDIDLMVDLANSTHDGRSSQFAEHVQLAITVASAPAIPDPSPGKLVAWRTSRRGSPGPKFNVYVDIGHNTFFYLN